MLKEKIFIMNIVFNTQFWAIIPALNINLHSKELEFEWLCLGVYIGKKEDESKITYDYDRR